MPLIDDFARQRDESRKRLLLLLAGFALLVVIVLVRLAYLQVVAAGDYRQQLSDWLELPPDYLPALRGDILDSRGNVLAQDVPSWQLEVRYGALDSKPRRQTGRSSYVYGLARSLRRAGQMPTDAPIEATEEILQQRIADSWQRLADLTNTPAWELYRSADVIVQRVRAIRDRVTERRGFEDDVEEQTWFHPLVKDLSMDQANRLRLEFADCPWFRIHTSTSRQAIDEPAACHLVGRLREANAEDLEKDTSTDPLHALAAGDRIGGEGVEYLAEDLLRGRRGMVRLNRAGDYLLNIDPVPGQDVHVTIDLELQRYIYERLGDAVQEIPNMASSASAVVIDVNTRELRAAVSWPGYTRKKLAEDYDNLVRDTVRHPLRNHAFADYYAPGSIVKPVTILAALSSGLAGESEAINCTGYLYPGKDVFRCWTVSRGMGGHGPLTARQAIQHSCNIYCYTMGHRLGVQRECDWFSMFGLGRSPGTGLPEEAVGVLPTPEYLSKRAGHPLTQAELVSYAQNFSTGQGELSLTPVQAANLGATIATGVWQPVVLIAEHADRSRAARRALPGTASAWQAIRNGMDDVVNDVSGTAYNHARSKGVRIAGKTGTAEAQPRKIGYVYELKMHDGSTRTMEFTSRLEADEKFARMGEAVVKWNLKGIRYWPAPPEPGKSVPTHAWFMGFAPAHKPEVAIAVLIEYGGGGGHTAGPVARNILDYIFEVEPTPDDSPH